MKLTMYMAMSLDGYIAGANDDTDWVSEAQWEAYEERLKLYDAVIVGRRTYDLMPTEEFYSEIPYLVVSSDANLKLKEANHYRVPVDAVTVLQKLDERDAANIVLIGGGQTNAAFAKAGLINEIIIDLEPVVLGQGIRLFGDESVDLNLELAETKQLTPSLTQLRYNVNT